MVCQAKRASDPIRASPAAMEAQVPVEVFWPRLHGRRDVTQPERPPGTMTQQVHAQVPEVIFAPKDACGRVAQLDDLRPVIKLVHGTVREVWDPAVQIDRTFPGVAAVDRGQGVCVLLRPNEKIDVAERPQTRFRIKPSAGPALGQKRLNAGRTETLD